MRAACIALLAALCQTSAHAHDWIYSAVPGDNVWNITERHLKGIRYWKQLQEYNGLETPDRILPGTRLRIPIRWLKVQPASAQVVAVVGQVQRVVSPDGTRHPARVGDELRTGDAIHTGAASSATVAFADRSRLLLQAETVLVMDSMSAYGTTGMVDTSMRLHKGRVESDVRPARGEASRYRITTPSAVVAVRGTSFRAAFEPSAGIAYGEVTEGSVAIAAARREQRVPAGFGVRAERGRPPEPPRPLLPAPDLAGLPERVPTVLVALGWPAVDGAVAYRVQIFPRATPDRLLLDRQSTRPDVELDAPPDGDYLLRVRGIDASGLEGLDARRAISVDARPVPPALLGPPADDRMHGKAPELWWSVPEGAERFHLQVARDAAFSDLLLDRPAVAGSRLVLDEEPAAGVYHWRVASVAGDGERGPFAAPRRFTVQAVPAATAASGRVEDGKVVIAWGRTANAARYEFQLARDDAFTEMVMTESLTETSYTLSELDTGTFYYRVRGVSDEGVAGPFGAVNRLEIPGEPLSPAWLLLLAPLLLLL